MKYPRGTMFNDSLVSAYVLCEVNVGPGYWWVWYKERLITAGVLGRLANGILVLPYGWAELMDQARALDAEHRLGGE